MGGVADKKGDFDREGSLCRKKKRGRVRKKNDKTFGRVGGGKSPLKGNCQSLNRGNLRIIKRGSKGSVNESCGGRGARPRGAAAAPPTLGETEKECRSKSPREKKRKKKKFLVRVATNTKCRFEGRGGGLRGGCSA